MKRTLPNKLLILIILLQSILSVNTVYAQNANTGIYFQAVARDNFSNPAKDRKIYVQSSIIQTTANGIKVLSEEYQTSTDATGVFSISLGQGTRVGGTASSLVGIDWSKGPYFLNLKVAITPIAPVTNWDFTKDWIDLGTTSFGAVPYALYSASAAGLDQKLSVVDTSKMLSIYAKALSVDAIAKVVGEKISTSDTSAMLAPYAKIVNTIVASNLTSLTANSINTALNSKVNVADSGSVYITPIQLKGVKFDTTSLSKRVDTKFNSSDTSFLLQKKDTITLSNRINTKEAVENKSTDVTLGGTNTSDILFPTQKAVKSYVDANSAGGGVVDGGISTIKLADLAVTDAKLATGISKSKVGLSNVENTTLSTWSGTNNITTLGTIGSGIWNGTKIDIANGGTGLNTAGSNGQILTSTNAGTLTWTTLPSAGVPYSGASGAVDLGGYNLTVNGITIGSNGTLDFMSTAYSSTILGKNASISNNKGNAIAIGYNANAAVQATALGSGATANVTQGMAIGFNTQSTSGYAMAVGPQATASGLYSTAIGNVATASADYSLAIGKQASATGINSTAIGNESSVSANNTIQLGNTSVTNIKTSGTITAGSVTYPSSHGSANQVLSTNGSGTLVWATASGGGSGVPYTGATAAVDLGANDLTANKVNTSSTITIGTGTSSINGKLVIASETATSASAALEVNSTTQGFLPPRMSQTQRDLITPVEGLMIYNTTTQTVQVYQRAKKIWGSRTADLDLYFSSTGNIFGQNFRSEATGQLKSITLSVTSFTTPGIVTLKMYQSTDGQGTEIGSTSLNITSNGLKTFEFNPTLSLTENTVYSFMCTTTEANFRFSYSNSNFKGGYDGGALIGNTRVGTTGGTVGNNSEAFFIVTFYTDLGWQELL
jgi:hypothetical protein